MSPGRVGPPQRGRHEASRTPLVLESDDRSAQSDGWMFCHATRLAHDHRTVALYLGPQLGFKLGCDACAIEQLTLTLLAEISVAKKPVPQCATDRPQRLRWLVGVMRRSAVAFFNILMSPGGYEGSRPPPWRSHSHAMTPRGPPGLGFQPLVSLVLPVLTVMLSVSISIRTIEH